MKDPRKCSAGLDQTNWATRQQKKRKSHNHEPQHIQCFVCIVYKLLRLAMSLTAKIAAISKSQIGSHSTSICEWHALFWFVVVRHLEILNTCMFMTDKSSEWLALLSLEDNLWIRRKFRLSEFQAEKPSFRFGKPKVFRLNSGIQSEHFWFSESEQEQMLPKNRRTQIIFYNDTEPCRIRQCMLNAMSLSWILDCTVGKFSLCLGDYVWSELENFALVSRASMKWDKFQNKPLPV
jgi:hypothetical protein